MAQINIGDVLRLFGSFTAIDSGLGLDPTTVTCVVHFPDGSTVTYTSASAPVIIRDSLGNYHLDLPITQNGAHLYRFVGTGVNPGVESGQFSVDPLSF